MAGSKRRSADPIIWLGAVVLVLIVLVSWSFRSGNFIAGTFSIDDLQICEELDESLLPVSSDINLSDGARQVCLWFTYSKARKGDSIEIVWYLNEKMIQRELIRLSDTRGRRAFYLLRDDGSSLAPGFYSVYITCNGREKVMENFSVAASSDDEALEDAPSLD
jgi:hypothetical protein